MYRNNRVAWTPRTSVRESRWFRTMWQGLSLLCVALSVTACVAQQADLVRLETDLRSKIAKLDRDGTVLARTLGEASQAIKDSKSVLSDLMEARAWVKNELRKLREENLAPLRGKLEAAQHMVGDFHVVMDKELARQSEESNQKLDDLAQQIDDQMQQRDKTVEEQFAGFRDSLVRFKDTMEQVDTQRAEDRNRATDAEIAMRQDLTSNQEALHEKLDSDTQALKTYLTTDVQKAIETINEALEQTERVLNDRLDAHNTQLSEFGTRLDTELTALQQADVRYGNELVDMGQSLTQLRDALHSMAGTLGERSDGHMKRLDRLDDAQTEQVSQTQSLSTHLTVTTEGLQKFREALQGYVKRMNEVTRIVEQLRNDMQSLRAGPKPKAQAGDSRSIELPTVRDPAQ